jgi:hypothetical protein
MDKYADLVIDDVLFYPTGMKIQWSSQSLGFGEVSFYNQDGQITVDSECMSKEFVKALLAKMVDKATF